MISRTAAVAVDTIAQDTGTDASGGITMIECGLMTSIAAVIVVTLLAVVSG